MHEHRISETDHLDQTSFCEREKKKQGLATLSPERIREIASMGGKACHAQGKGHQWTSEEAREAGRKGGLIGGRAPRRKTAEKRGVA